MMKNILLDQKSELEEKERRTTKIVEREFLSSYKEFLKSKLTKVSTGVRRCGKSFSIYLLLKPLNFAYINFDEKLLIKAPHHQILSALFETYGDVKVFFFDEIQNLEGWELLINKLHRSGYNIFITGSNAGLLSRELGDRLTGRHIDMEIFPFSFREFLRAREFRENIETTKGSSLLKRLLFEYLKTSGFPEVVVERENPKIYLRTLFNDIVEKDIVWRFGIREEATFREIAFFLLANIGNRVTFNSIKNSFSLGSDHTAKNYILYLQLSYLILTLEKFSFSVKERVKSPRKVYAVDPTFSTISFKFSSDLGKVMENLVLVDLIRRKSYEFKAWEFYYFQDYQQREVDFVVKEGMNIKQLIQVTYASAKDEIEKREINALLKASKLLNCKDLLVITWDYEDELKIGNRKIVFKPLWKWLLE